MVGCEVGFALLTGVAGVEADEVVVRGLGGHCEGTGASEVQLSQETREQGILGILSPSTAMSGIYFQMTQVKASYSVPLADITLAAYSDDKWSRMAMDSISILFQTCNTIKTEFIAVYKKAKKDREIGH